MVMPACGSWLIAGRTPDSHVPGDRAWTGPMGAWLSMFENTVVIDLYLSSGFRMSPNSPIAPSLAGVHRFITAPCGK